ncbi:hypothetical protein [Psychrobacillus sp.]|uniref:hypothetical protein n=1 Tax=Psychrobacillus sp. TaxID=1871623 RepID=UPI0028BE971D|nr:hypothetical protein [Psychrobacillus sp.]
MSLFNRGITNRGNNNQNLQIDTVNIINKKLNRSKLFQFCINFSERIEEEPSENTNLSPSEFDEKMEYNKMGYYKTIFRDCDHYLDDVQTVLNSIPKKHLIISRINYKYLEFKSNYIIFEDTDLICREIEDYLKIQADNSYSPQDIILDDEEIIFAIQALMYYTFTRCKILEPVPEEEN